MKPHEMLDAFYAFLARPLRLEGRILLALSVIPLALAFFFPLWRISMVAPQYPGGLWLEIYSHTVNAGGDGQHLQEINTLNHYIGMKPIDRVALSDLDWLPFALGGLLVFTLRVAAIGNVRSLLDLVVLSGYAMSFGLGRFVYRLWVFGHNLDPKAPVKVAPFMPATLGHKRIANFDVTSWPGLGTFLIGVFLLTLLAVTVWHLASGRREARARLSRPIALKEVIDAA
jgi:copper chaperone NosL